MKIVLVVDLDGVLCEETKPYSKARPIAGAKEFLDDWMANGTVTIYTSRRECDRQLTKQWLKRHGFKYTRLIMGKPKGNFYIDDKAVPFLGNWKEMPSCVS